MMSIAKDQNQKLLASLSEFFR